jgi:hypothetical protein
MRRLGHASSDDKGQAEVIDSRLRESSERCGLKGALPQPSRDVRGDAERVQAWSICGVSRSDRCEEPVQSLKFGLEIASLLDGLMIETNLVASDLHHELRSRHSFSWCTGRGGAPSRCHRVGRRRRRLAVHSTAAGCDTRDGAEGEDTHKTTAEKQADQANNESLHHLVKSLRPERVAVGKRIVNAPRARGQGGSRDRQCFRSGAE